MSPQHVLCSLTAKDQHKRGGQSGEPMSLAHMGHIMCSAFIVTFGYRSYTLKGAEKATQRLFFAIENNGLAQA